MDDTTKNIAVPISLERFLDHLIDPLECIDIYERTYLDDLEFIAIENHGYDPKLHTFPLLAVQQYFEALCKQFQFKSIRDVADYVRQNLQELSLADSRPRTSFYDLAQFGCERPEEYKDFLLHEKSDPIAANNEFQIAWSGRGIEVFPEFDRNADLYEMFLSSDRLSPWTYLIRREIARGNLAKNDKTICIGPRWAGEILYFRQYIGLRETIGIDLLPSQPDLIIASDMHSLPFENNSVKFAFCRGVIDKSYDPRLFAQELKRVLKPDGFVMIESVGPHPQGVNCVGRTDVKMSANLLKLFNGVTERVIFQQDRPPLSSTVRVRNIITIFIQINKTGHSTAPIHEEFPFIQYFLYWKVRRLFLRVRIKIKKILGIR
jgi:hypothetical protein